MKKSNIDYQFYAMNANAPIRHIYDLVQKIKQDEFSMAAFAIEGKGTTDQVYRTTYGPLVFKFEWQPWLKNYEKIWIQLMTKEDELRHDANYFCVEPKKYESDRLLYEDLKQLGTILDNRASTHERQIHLAKIEALLRQTEKSL